MSRRHSEGDSRIRYSKPSLFRKWWPWPQKSIQSRHGRFFRGRRWDRTDSPPGAGTQRLCSRRTCYCDVSKGELSWDWTRVKYITLTCMISSDLIWSDLIWSDLIWSDLIWSDLIWFDLILLFCVTKIIEVLLTIMSISRTLIFMKSFFCFFSLSIDT